MKINLNSFKFSILFLILIIIIPSFGFNLTDKKDAPGISAIPNKKSYSPGESGVLTITFKTGSKVKIPKDPEITVDLTSADVEGSGVQDYSGDEGDYISGSKIKYNFTVPGGAASGSTLTVSGNVRFGYCSTTDGVCKLGNRNFTAKIKVR